MLDRCIEKLNEVALDLREMSDRSDPKHQAKKVDQVISDLECIRGGEPAASTQVHGSGTGKE